MTVKELTFYKEEFSQTSVDSRIKGSSTRLTSFHRAGKLCILFAMSVLFSEGMVLPSVLAITKDDDGKYSNGAWDETGGDKMDK